MKKLAAVGLAVTALAALGFSLADKVQKGTQSPAYQGSIPVQEGQNEAQEANAYLSLAKVSQQEAVAIAQKALGTQAAPTKVQLGVENGYLVWEVVLAGQEVKVDAGTGQVLHQEAYGQEEDKGAHEEHEGAGGMEEGE
ncbi:hypothetical protein TthAA37_22110 (plasmid) [Thermus thermophilus]|uniref:PepSY domain-containing protein n=1 Tax=Thermus thermophilus TaxID=274 RepID=A0AAD1KXH0_THETH|nr:PepSY domain-containing protein [Thermus thermophilus]BBL83346.1 hypothetical protein TthAA220_21300 [Thermus thermophilus]BBL85619.1 hypothetical protein TthAA229_21000 [Thermus thermophilus]BCZ88036.1 hypothetical protein TthAA11_22180 [Thermus thermophilus]BCZ90348.1 hypothetical protein TthAA22_21530 [Thermus thermophilus]BCZ93022.1 hypothetical protein TthAA37_22110 [Thermus thermophilus]